MYDYNSVWYAVQPTSVCLLHKNGVLHTYCVQSRTHSLLMSLQLWYEYHMRLCTHWNMTQHTEHNGVYDIY